MLWEKGSRKRGTRSVGDGASLTYIVWSGYIVSET